MKIRNGFVSNSSSSSFIIAYKNKVNEEEFVKNVLLIPEQSPLFNFGKEVYQLFISNSIEIKDVDKWVKDSYFEESYDEVKDIRALKEKGFTVRDGSFSSENYGLESYLTDIDFNVKTENLIIKHVGGY